MPYAIRQLIARGYWEPNGDEKTSGGGGGGDDKVDNDKGSKDDKSGDDKAGKSGVTDKEAELLKEVMTKKTKISELSTQLEQVNATLKKFEGLDPVAVRALLAAEEERKVKDLESKGNYEALKKQLVDTHAAELGLSKAELAKALDSASGLTAKIADLTVGVAFGQSKFIADDLATAYSVSKTRKLFGDHFVFDGEKVVGYDKPAGKKDRAVLIDGKGEPLSFDDALRKLVDADEDRDSMLKSKTKPGAGTKTDNKAKVVEEKVELSGRGKISAGLATRAA